VSAVEAIQQILRRRFGLLERATWKQDWAGVSKLLPKIEAKLAPFHAKPHWGKLFTMPPSNFRMLYPKFEDFRKLAMQYDPSGKFRNGFLEKNIFF